MPYSYIIFALLIVLAISQDDKKSCKSEQECKENIELGIVLDLSNSIYYQDLDKAKEFLDEFVTYFNIGPDKTRVALVPYGSKVYADQAFNLATYNTVEDLQDTIYSIKRPEQLINPTTETGDAIAFMRDHQFNPEQSRKGVRRACVVLTDGNSQDKHKTAREAKKARDDGIHMFAVGVGPEVNQTELLRIAEKSRSVNHVGAYGELIDILQGLVRKTCSEN